jgi:glycosyltransferase involved in cell wall biosynthesis
MKDHQKPLVSIVIPYHEALSWLPETLDSVFAQSYKNFEVIIIDDGSKNFPLNRHQGILYTNEERRKKIRIYTQQNKGLAAARNAGIEKSVGEYIVPLDADDLLHPIFLEKCVEEFKRNPDVGFVYTGFVFFGDKKSHSRLQEYNFYILLQSNFLIATAMFLKKAWREVGGYDENMRGGMEDWEFWIRLGKHAWFGKLIPEYLFFYRQRKGSMFEGAFSDKKNVLRYIHAKHADLFSPSALNRVKKDWEKKLGAKAKIFYLLKSIFINETSPIFLQKSVRNLYYFIRR